MTDKVQIMFSTRYPQMLSVIVYTGHLSLTQLPTDHYVELLFEEGANIMLVTLYPLTLCFPSIRINDRSDRWIYVDSIRCQGDMFILEYDKYYWPSHYICALQTGMHFKKSYAVDIGLFYCLHGRSGLIARKRSFPILSIQGLYVLDNIDERQGLLRMIWQKA